MTRTLGILLDRWILNHILAGRQVFEAVELYRQPAAEFGLALALFEPHGIDRRRRRVRARRFPAFAPVWLPVPAVVHNRALQYPSANRAVRWLGRQGAAVFNPLVPAGKYAKHLALASSPALRPHLPAALPLSPRGLGRLPALLEPSGSVFVKPATGSRGKGILRVRRGPGRSYLVNGAAVGRADSFRRLRRRLARLSRRRRYILQQGITLARFQGRPFDLRVHLQRGEGGRWTVPGMGARRANLHPFLTNLTRGGSAHPVREVLPAAFPGRDPEAIAEQVRRVALLVGETLERAWPGVADLGLDVGLDADARPWILEVNLRELRYTLRDAGEPERWALTYRNPVAYARHLFDIRATAGMTGRRHA